MFLLILTFFIPYHDDRQAVKHLFERGSIKGGHACSMYVTTFTLFSLIIFYQGSKDVVRRETNKKRRK